MNALRTVIALAATYTYFLIFAQFAFLEGLAERGLDASGLKPVMAAMGLSGVAGAVLAPLLVSRFGPRRSMQGAFALCGVAALLSIPAANGILLAALIGLALGILTVVIAATLREAIPFRHTGWIVGWGTGLAYAVCNVPTLFESTWQIQTTAAALVALGGIASVPNHFQETEQAPRATALSLWLILPILFSLVWLDSAAFYLIQHTDELKKATWGHAHLWRNAALHLAAAVATGWILDRGRLVPVLLTALALLTVAARMVSEAPLAQLAGWLYPVGVSLYSVVLVAYPGVLSGARDRATSLRRAAIVFAIAGWIGSGLGIGMAENLMRVPAWFLAAVWVPMVILAIRRFPRMAPRPAMAACALPVIWVLADSPVRNGHEDSPIARGRTVYVSEGCIHCHSRYVRPGSPDVLTRGPARNIGELVQEEPVLIGNRRQGPDLLQVGVRRSAKWLELHFRKPRSLHPGSTMPSYAHLWNDSRGDDLISFLTDTTSESWQERLETISHWQPQGDPALDGSPLFSRHCAVCHGREGHGKGELASEFAKPPANLVDGPFPFTGQPQGTSDKHLAVARIIKFGIPGTDMPGHEHLTDPDVLALADYVVSLRGPTQTLTQSHD